MKFMVFVMGDERSEAGEIASEEEFREMGKYNEQLVQAGIMLAGEGLHPTSKGAKIRYDANGTATVIDGPFSEAKEVVAGFWIWQVKSREEAIEWVRRAPFKNAELQLRQVYADEDFGDALPDDVRELESRLRSETEARQAQQ